VVLCGGGGGGGGGRRRAAPPPRVEIVRLAQRLFGAEGDDGVQRAVEPFDPLKRMPN